MSIHRQGMSDDESDDVSLEIEPHQGDMDYNPEFEQLLKENGDHAQVYSILHEMAHVKYRALFDKCNIPLIIITAVIGFVTGIGLPYPYTNTVLGAASVFVSILKSIISYLKLSERSENHRICSLQFAHISTEIKMELSLRRNQRQPAKMMLDVVKVKYKNLMEVASLIDNDVIQRFREKYLLGKESNSEVALPLLFSTIPGIKILGSNSDKEHQEQMEKSLDRYRMEKQFERDHMESELKHIAALRTIREKYRLADRGKEEVQAVRSSNAIQSSNALQSLLRQKSLEEARLAQMAREAESQAERASPSERVVQADSSVSPSPA